MYILKELDGTMLKGVYLGEDEDEDEDRDKTVFASLWFSCNVICDSVEGASFFLLWKGEGKNAYR